VDGFEMALRAVVGQQISVAGARTVLGRLAGRYGQPAFDSGPDWLLFPSPELVADLDPGELPMPAARGRTITTFAAAIAGGELELDAGSDRDATRQRLLALPGVGPWTADYLLMRAVGDPDVYLRTDLGVRRALDRLVRQPAGSTPDPSAAALDPRSAALDPRSAAPWRSYLTHHLWAAPH
jgi:AraC family transcriptional regulator, regulatory protein of adaptative response / DNA-3-methyladenine glycosylase II